MEASSNEVERGVTAAKPLLLPAEHLKHYQEGRTDVRSYAGFLIQVVTLLLSTLIIVLGWFAKDYATEKYHVAIRAAAPEFGSDSGYANSAVPVGPRQSLSDMPRPQANEAVGKLERKLDFVSSVYQHVLVFSPTTSVLLCGASFFSLVTLAMLVILTYQLQRRRYHYHEVGHGLGLEPDEPIVDPVLTGGALNAFIAIVGSGAFFLYGTTVIQTSVYGYYTSSWLVKTGLVLMVILLTILMVSVFIMALNYREFERREGWNARWARAERLAKKIQSKALGHAECGDQLTIVVNDLVSICEQGGKTRWLDARTTMSQLDRGLHRTTLGAEIEEDVSDLRFTLGHRRAWKKIQ